MSICPLDKQKCLLDTQMSIHPKDQQKCPLDIQMSICPFDQLRCPMDEMDISVGPMTFECPLAILHRYWTLMGGGGGGQIYVAFTILFVHMQGQITGYICGG